MDKFGVFINYGILIIVVALVFWMIEDSLKRTGNKWFFPIFSVITSFLPFLEELAKAMRVEAP